MKARFLAGLAVAVILLLPLPPAFGFLGLATLTWNDNSDDEDGFKVQESINGGQWFNAVTIAKPNVAHATAYLVPGIKYCFRIVAYSVVGGDAEPSNVVCKRFDVQDLQE